ncbi:MAG TPA: type I 3-dehydroquinate dehydratase [Thermoanaerobaculia bacterium]|nr:type I 3-dehydroquinate dehydratase [Thermoanaerobaculia bacterium]
MARIVLTVHEETPEEALAQIRAWSETADAVELRLDAFADSGSAVDFDSFRRAFSGTLIATRRGGGMAPGEARRAIAAGFDLIDLELETGKDLSPFDDLLPRSILSFHDFAGVPDLAPLLHSMLRSGAAHVKVAVTPSTFDEDRRLLATLQGVNAWNLTLFGMGSRGLYSRILAPFFGSELTFVSVPGRPAAPGQLSVERAAVLWGDGSQDIPEALFAVVGNPAAHSLSPAIHNARFRAAGAPAAYSIIETESFQEVAEALMRGDELAPRGISITAPFKEEAFAFARRHGATISSRASACGSINTLMRTPDAKLLADNTDVEGISRNLPDGSLAASAVIGSGGTSRAAILALRERGSAVTVFARRPDRIAEFASLRGAKVRSLEELRAFRGDVLVNTVSGDALVEMPDPEALRGCRVIDVSYAAGRLAKLAELRDAGVEAIGGIEVLEAQADAQNELFIGSLEMRPGVERDRKVHSR